MIPFNQLSYWEKTTYIESIDFLIIGSGIVGLSTAIELRNTYPEAKIMIVERGYLPSGASTKNAGFSCFGSPSEILDDLQHFTLESVKNTLKLRYDGLCTLRKRLGDEAIEFSACGSYDLFTEKDRSNYEKCVEQLPFLNTLIEETIGLPNCYSIVEDCPSLGMKDIIGAIYNQYEGSIHTGKMMDALIRLVNSSNIILFNSIEVQQITSNASTITVRTTTGDLVAQKVILCTNGLTKQLYPTIDLQPARAQVIVTSPIPNLKLNSTYHYDKGYYYFRVVDENRILIGGARNAALLDETTDEISTTPFILSKINELLSTVVLPDTSFTVEYEWAGIMGVGNEKKPIVKELEPNVYCGVRLGGMGVAMGSEMGKMIVQMIEKGA